MFRVLLGCVRLGRLGRLLRSCRHRKMAPGDGRHADCWAMSFRFATMAAPLAATDFPRRGISRPGSSGSSLHGRGGGGVEGFGALQHMSDVAVHSRLGFTCVRAGTLNDVPMEDLLNCLYTTWTSGQIGGKCMVFNMARFGSSQKSRRNHQRSPP